MRFKSFKGFMPGKTKNGHGGGPARESASAEPVSLMGEKINGRTKDLEEMTGNIQKLAGSPTGEKDTGPHGPLGELSIEPADRSENEVADILVQEDDGQSQTDIKMVEMSINEKPDEEKKPAADAVDPGNPLSGLFSDEEEEENPLANLIKSLPDYTTHEIVEDLNEIKRIIHEWHRG
jgi:hypothetical protein